MADLITTAEWQPLPPTFNWSFCHPYLFSYHYKTDQQVPGRVPWLSKTVLPLNFISRPRSKVICIRHPNIWLIVTSRGVPTWILFTLVVRGKRILCRFVGAGKFPSGYFVLFSFILSLEKRLILILKVSQVCCFARWSQLLLLCTLDQFEESTRESGGKSGPRRKLHR